MYYNFPMKRYFHYRIDMFHIFRIATNSISLQICDEFLFVPNLRRTFIRCIFPTNNPFHHRFGIMKFHDKFFFVANLQWMLWWKNICRRFYDEYPFSSQIWDHEILQQISFRRKFVTNFATTKIHPKFCDEYTLFHRRIWWRLICNENFSSQINFVLIFLKFVIKFIIKWSFSLEFVSVPFYLELK